MRVWLDVFARTLQAYPKLLALLERRVPELDVAHSGCAQQSLPRRRRGAVCWHGRPLMAILTPLARGSAFSSRVGNRAPAPQLEHQEPHPRRPRSRSRSRAARLAERALPRERRAREDAWVPCPGRGALQRDMGADD